MGRREHIKDGEERSKRLWGGQDLIISRALIHGNGKKEAGDT